jgi:predicted DNA-binding transcriptional regulator AlpA
LDRHRQTAQLRTALSDSLPNSQPLLTAGQVAELIGGATERTVRRAAHAGKLPRPVQVSARLIRWRRDELIAWIEAGCPSREIWETMKN